METPCAALCCPSLTCRRLHSQVQLIEVFNICDADGDGTLTAAELQSFIQDHGQVLWALGKKGHEMKAFLEACCCPRTLACCTDPDCTAA